MAQVASVTIGSTAYPVYGLTSAPVTDADTYFAAAIAGAPWSSVSTTVKQQALVSAARMMDRRATFTGTRTVASQDLAWPRDSATKCGEAVTDGTVPDDIALAQFELALALINNASIANSATTGQNIKSAKAGSAAVEFFLPTVGTSLATQFPQPVHELLRCYLDSATATAGPTVTGADPDCCNQRSTFDECGGGFGLTRGF